MSEQSFMQLKEFIVHLPKSKILAGESLSQFVDLAGGLRPDADSNKVEITRFISSKEKFSLIKTKSS